MRARTAVLRHALLVVAGYTLLFGWVFGHLLTGDQQLSESDLYDWFLPMFLATPTAWTSSLLAGLPTFADTSVAVQYPVQFLFARVLGWWNGYVIAGYVLAASFTHAFAWRLTRSHMAAIVAAVAFGLSEAMLERQAHINFVHAFAWLPLVLLATDHLLERLSGRWVAVGAVALAGCFLAGHPQPVLYVAAAVAVHGLVGGLATGHRLRWFAGFAAMFALGGLLSGIKAIPFLEVVPHVTRTVVRFEAFIAQSHTPAQMLGVIFPSIVHNGREAPLHVGLVALVLAGVGIAASWRSWRTRVWVAIAVCVLCVGAGDATPVAGLLYRLPVVNQFRVAPRMLFLFAFAVATFAAVGVATLERDVRARGLAWRAAAGLAVVVLAGAVVLGVQPGLVGFEPGVLTGRLPLWDPGVWRVLVLLPVAVAALVWFGRAPRAASGALLACVLAADLLTGAIYPLTWLGIRPVTVATSALAPSVHARALADALGGSGQRLLAFGGTTRDALVPAGFAKVWDIPIAGGYSPITFDRLARLALMGGNGDVRVSTLAFEDRALDLLAVRYLVVRDDDFSEAAPFEREGRPFARTPLSIPIEYPGCVRTFERTRELTLPADVAVAEVTLVLQMRCGEDAPQDGVAARVELLGPDGSVDALPLVVGRDLSDRELSNPDVLARAKHQRVTAFDDPDLAPDTVRVRLVPARPVRGARLRLTGFDLPGWTTVERITVVGSDGQAWPLTPGPLFLEEPRRWRRLSHVRTSRQTDRLLDEEAPGELGFTIYENLRALPRAWLAPRVAELGDEDALDALRHSQLPDGQPWDPRLEALVPPGEGAPSVAVGASRVSASTIEDGIIQVDVESDGGGMLVLSEMFYPGWRARIGTREAPVRRVDFALQGVVVPAGRHTVRFTFEPVSLRVGAGVSLAALALVAVLLRRRGAGAGGQSEG